MDSSGQRMDYLFFFFFWDIPATFGCKIWLEVWQIVFGRREEFGRKMADQRRQIGFNFLLVP